MLYISTHLSVVHGGNISKTVFIYVGVGGITKDSKLLLLFVSVFLLLFFFFSLGK